MLPRLLLKRNSKVDVFPRPLRLHPLRQMDALKSRRLITNRSTETKTKSEKIPEVSDALPKEVTPCIQ